MNTHHDPIRVLMHEHEFIKKVVASLGRLAASSDEAKNANPETLREIVRFMREFADRCHHAKEEDLLFPAMEDKGVPESGCPLGSLLKEHQQGRALVTNLSEATEALVAGKPEAADSLVETVGEITNLYTNRFSHMMIGSVILGFLASIVGLVISYYLDIPSGASIIFTLVILYLAARLIKVLTFGK